MWRRAVGTVASVTAASCWLTALVFPWTSAGALSSASLLDAVELIRQGTVDAVVPAPMAVVILLPALASIVVLGVLGFRGRTARIVRASALVVGSVASLVLGARLTGFDAGAVGPGVWIALVGVLAACAAALPSVVPFD